MTTTSGPDAGGTPPRHRHRVVIALAVAAVLAVVVIGVGIWRHGDGPSTPSAVANAAPDGGAADNAASGDPQPNPDAVKLRSSFVGLPLNTHVTIDVNTPDQCVQNKHNQAFDIKGSPVNRTDVLFEARYGPGTCNHGNNSWMTVTATNGQVTKTRRVNLYNGGGLAEHSPPQYQVNCDGGDPTTLTCAPTGGGANLGSAKFGWS
jgi:hypothetical protein